MTRALCLVLCLATAAQADYAADLKSALGDFALVPEQDRPYVRYLSLHSAPEEFKARDVLGFVLPHLSTQQILERCGAAQVSGGMYRIDLRDLHWTKRAWSAVVKEYPYDPSGDPLIVRGDWLIAVTADAQLSSAYYDLLYAEKRHPDSGKPAPVVAVPVTPGRPFPHTGGPRRDDARPRKSQPAKPAPKPSGGIYTPEGNQNFPANAKEFFDFWRVTVAEEFVRASIVQDGESGVAHRRRQVEFYGSPFGPASRTFDSEDASGSHNPLTRIDGGLEYDATEIIVGMPKVSLKDGETVFAQAYLLTDGQDRRINEASVRIVTDKTDLIPAIRTPGSCIRCHTSGILNLPRSLVRSIIEDGVELYNKDKDAVDELERKHLARLDRAIGRHQEDFELFVELVCDLTPAQVVSNYSKLVAHYEAPLTLETAAVEVYATDAAELRNAIGLYAERHGATAADLALLAHGERISRSEFEKSIYHQATAALAAWRERR